jgi:hypothetical protein
MKRKNAKNDKLPMNFIVRIYRFHGEGPEGMAGLVETVGNGVERRFTGIEELWEILASSGKKPGRRKYSLS